MNAGELNPVVSSVLVGSVPCAVITPMAKLKCTKD